MPPYIHWHIHTNTPPGQQSGFVRYSVKENELLSVGVISKALTSKDLYVVSDMKTMSAIIATYEGGEGTIVLIGPLQ